MTQPINMEHVHVDGSGPAPVPKQCLSQPPKAPQKQQHRAAFKRRASVSKDKPFCPPRASQNSQSAVTHGTTAVDGHPLARVCGPSRSKCGYCGGKRINVLELDDGHNKVLPIAKENNNSASINNGSSVNKIDVLKTTKSYGLLFDILSYDTYEDLINRGWRRSGKHLYRPHNFESCCPALSIRLESRKFASRGSTPQKSKLESDVANSVLVGGSRSQRRVGRNLLRALDKYNTKCLQSEDDSVNAYNLSNIQLDNSDDKKPTKPIICNSDEHYHQKKKSRRFSPCRGSDQTLSAALEKREFDRTSLQEFENTEQPFLRKMANLAYKELTKQAITAFSERANNAEKLDKPHWAWWNDSESEEIPKWCTFKLVSQGASIKASTVTCVAASGRSRGALDTLELARVLVGRLKESANSYLQSNKSSRIRQVTEVIVHKKSGHVHMILDVSGNTLVTTLSDAAKKISAHQPQKAADERADPIQEMISRYGRLDQQFNPNAKMPLSDICTKRFLTVRSTPVYESSLQPEVHRLFCLPWLQLFQMLLRKFPHTNHKRQLMREQILYKK